MAVIVRRCTCMPYYHICILIQITEYLMGNIANIYFALPSTIWLSICRICLHLERRYTSNSTFWWTFLHSSKNAQYLSTGTHWIKNQHLNIIQKMLKDVTYKNLFMWLVTWVIGRCVACVSVCK